MAKLIIKKAREFDLPRGTRVITNDEFITLAKKKGGGVFEIFTCQADIFEQEMVYDETKWFDMTTEELEKILAL